MISVCDAKEVELDLGNALLANLTSGTWEVGSEHVLLEKTPRLEWYEFTISLDSKFGLDLGIYTCEGIPTDNELSYFKSFGSWSLKRIIPEKSEGILILDENQELEYFFKLPNENPNQLYVCYYPISDEGRLDDSYSGWELFLALEESSN